MKRNNPFTVRGREVVVEVVVVSVMMMKIRKRPSSKGAALHVAGEGGGEIGVLCPLPEFHFLRNLL